jgi:hypothetical protein
MMAALAALTFAVTTAKADTGVPIQHAVAQQHATVDGSVSSAVYYPDSKPAAVEQTQWRGRGWYGGWGGRGWYGGWGGRGWYGGWRGGWGYPSYGWGYAGYYPAYRGFYGGYSYPSYYTAAYPSYTASYPTYHTASYGSDCCCY